MPIPDVPDDLTLNYSQPWAFIQDSGYRYYVNVRWGFIDNWSLSAGGGMVDGDDDNGFYSAFGLVQDEEGTLTQFPFRRFRTKTESYGALAKLDGDFDLGSVSKHHCRIHLPQRRPVVSRWARRC